MPVVPIVEGDVKPALRAGDKQPAPQWIFLDDVHVHAGRKTSRDLLPGLPHVAGAIDVRLEVLELMTIYARVRRVWIEVRSLDHRYSAPGRDCARRHVLPALAVIQRELNESVVRADPDHRSPYRGWRDCVDHAALSISIDRGCGARIECWRHEDLRTGEIGTDLRPRLRAVRCFEHELIRVVKRARIRLGENEGLRPVASRRLGRFWTRRAFSARGDRLPIVHRDLRELTA